MAIKKNTKDKNGLVKELEIPAGVNVEIVGRNITISKNSSEIKKIMNNIIIANVEGNKLIFRTIKNSKTEKKILGSIVAHLKNAFEGLNQKFKYKLQVASVHFPITLDHNKTTNEIIVKNFLGEKKPRVIKVYPGVDIKITKDVIELESHDIEKAGQTAANIEKGTKIRLRDRRVFQDGIFIVEKPGVNFMQ